MIILLRVLGLDQNTSGIRVVNKVFSNLDKKNGNQNQIWKLIFDEKEIDEDVEILNID